jgi:molybdenum cofactor cytidylyltransferase
MALGIILAAGRSSRAKTNKMMLDVDGIPVIRHAVKGMMPFVRHISVVTGYDATPIVDALEGIDFVTCVHNDDYDQGMFSSVRTGLKGVDEDVFILPGDCPFVSPDVYEALLEADGDIRVPAFKGRKGHPLFIKGHLAKEVVRMPEDATLKTFRDMHPVTVVETQDPFVLSDIDTIEDFEAALKARGKE